MDSFRALALQVKCQAVNQASDRTEASQIIQNKDAAKISRAVENMAYVVSANTAGIANIPIPIASADGGSKIIDHRGIALAEAGVGENMTAFAEIDLAA
jgi:predicted amidohydrolase